MKNLFGKIAVEKGFINMEQLTEATLIQKSEERKYVTLRRIGQISREEGYMNEAQIEEILDSM